MVTSSFIDCQQLLEELRKISLFVSGKQVSYLPRPKDEANN